MLLEDIGLRLGAHAPIPADTRGRVQPPCPKGAKGCGGGCGRRPRAAGRPPGAVRVLSRRHPYGSLPGATRG
ncbi:hypothetical protein STXM2123_2009 [Streptomyces sp. F-3]|nr:hypothetical protein STXM2123_2009 [Streptomyces sp. F-3]